MWRIAVPLFSALIDSSASVDKAEKKDPGDLLATLEGSS
jgi:hypothetical protein